MPGPVGLNALLGAGDDAPGSWALVVCEAEAGGVVEIGSGEGDELDETIVGVAPMCEFVEKLEIGGVGSIPERVPGLKPLEAETLEGPVDAAVAVGEACDRLTRTRTTSALFHAAESS